MYSQVDVEEDPPNPLVRSLSSWLLIEHHLVAKYDVTLLMFGCISLMAGLSLTIFTLVMGRKEEAEDTYDTVLLGPILIGKE